MIYIKFNSNVVCKDIHEYELQLYFMCIIMYVYTHNDKILFYYCIDILMN